MAEDKEQKSDVQPEAAAPEAPAEVKQEEKKPEAQPKADTPEAKSIQEAKDILADPEQPAVAVKAVGKGKKAKMMVPAGIAHIKSTFNNTLVSITDMKGGVVAWSSAGKAGFKGSRKSTAFAATLVGQDAARQAMARGMREVEVRVQGAGSGRESAVRALQSSGLNISVIKDITPVPHNGCRPRKRRRV